LQEPLIVIDEQNPFHHPTSLFLEDSPPSVVGYDRRVQGGVCSNRHPWQRQGVCPARCGRSRHKSPLLARMV